MSHVAIAAALAFEDVSAAERLAAFSLASYANREQRAWPGTRVAAARAGLSRSQYLAARDGLQKRRRVAVEESGRKRQRTVVVELDQVRKQLRQPAEVDLADWERIGTELRCAVGESTFEIWLAGLHPAATDWDGCVLLASPPATRSWVADRYGPLLEKTGRSAGRELRLASDRELRLLEALAATQSRPLLTHQSDDQSSLDTELHAR
jgi:hypothetical protein